MGKQNFQHIYLAAAQALGERPTIKLSTFCETYKPEKRYMGMIVYHAYGQFKWQQRVGQGLAAGYRGRAFYVLILCTDDWPVGVQNEKHRYLYRKYFNMDHRACRACCGGFSVLNGQTEHSSSMVNGSRGSVHGLSWQCDGSHTLSAYEESLVDVAIDVWKRGGPGSVAAVPDWRHVAIMKQQAAPAPQYQPVPAPLYASATAPPQRYSQVPQYCLLYTSDAADE